MQFILRRLLVFALFLLAVPASADWRALGPDGGTVVALAVDPGDSRTVYAATQLFGRLFKTVDGGETWRLSDQGLPAQSVLRTIAVDPRRRATVWAATAQNGVYKSTDAGASWSPSLSRRAGFDGTTHDLAVDPQRPAVVYAATSAGIFKTANGGGEWKRKSAGLPDGEVFVVEADPGQLGRVYASAGLNGVFRTRNGGETWERAGRGLPANDAVLSFAAAPGVVYAGTNAGRVFKSADGGATWTQVDSGLPRRAVRSLAVHPRTPRIVYAGLSNSIPFLGPGIYRSGNGGATWTAAVAGLTNQEVWELAFGSPDSGLPGAPLYAGTGGEVSPGGVFRSDDGRTWRRVVGELSATSVRDVAAEPGDPGVLWSALGNLGLFRSADAGLTWTSVPLAADVANIRAIEEDPRSPETLYVLADTLSAEGLRLTFFRTTDSGDSWTRIALPPGGFIDVEVDPRTGALFLLGQSFSFSMDGGATWRQPAAGSVSALIWDVAFPDSPATVVYAAGFYHSGGRLDPPQARVFKSADGGATWTRSDAGLEGVLSIRRIVAVPGAPSTLFATDGSSIFRTTDAGATWQRTFGPSAVDVIRDLLAGPDGTLYAYSVARGVFTSRDGATWTQFAPPLPPGAETERIILDPDDPETLYAASSYGVQVFTSPDSL
jgi:photosystem II stability/assembly factor-like uncharacterized protein